MTTKSLTPWGVVLLLLALGLALPPAALAADEEPMSGKARTFLASLGERAIHVAQDKAAPKADRETRIRALLREGFDLDIISRLVLGKHWRKMSDSQRDEFVGVFENAMVQQSLTIFGGYTNETFDITSVGPDPTNPKLIAITTNIKRSNGATAKVDWRLRKRGQDYKIIDIVAEGVSMALTLRQEYGAVIERSGGKVDGLIEELRKTAA
ncbi:MAG: ABC transporter substrate-binding protein [Kiloniellales bacterium]|nr:ABC transporter substrate-binding protein [Kiloniellales bacterium]